MFYTLKVIELFAGIGSQTQALTNIGVEHEVVGIAEIDKYAIMSYEAIHGKVNNFGDISKISELPKADLWTYSFPCQDLSVAGKLKGCSKGSGTRSGLLWEVERLLDAAKENNTLPKYLLLENVKNLVGEQNLPDFNLWLQKLDSLGYQSYWKVLNAKDYGVPQNRERIFVVSILNGTGYEFPKSKKLDLRLKDLLETNVDDKYYLSVDKIEKIAQWNAYQKPLEKVQGKNSVVPTLTARGAGEEHSGMIIFSEDLEETTNLQNKYLNTIKEDNSIIVKENNKKGYTEAFVGDTINLERPTSTTRRGRVGKQVAQTIMTQQQQVVVEPICNMYDITQMVNVRKYDVDIDGLKNLLKSAKKKSKLTNQQIAEKLNVPITKVEHWFRNDTSFTIPCVENWIYLKSLLNIETNEFDKSIMTFEQRENVFEKANRAYDTEGIAATIIASEKGLNIIDPTIVASKGITNTITCAQKDNYIAEPSLRIRKLTALECWRLMGQSDEAFYKAKLVCSESQLYKQAGNSIVVNVLEAIFTKLFIDTELEDYQYNIFELMNIDKEV